MALATYITPLSGLMCGDGDVAHSILVLDNRAGLNRTEVPFCTRVLNSPTELKFRAAQAGRATYLTPPMWGVEYSKATKAMK
jgi:hypothetical protein